MMDQKNAMKLNPGGVHGGPTSQLDYKELSFNLNYDIDIYEKTIEISKHSICMWMDVFSWSNIYEIFLVLNNIKI